MTEAILVFLSLANLAGCVASFISWRRCIEARRRADENWRRWGENMEKAQALIDAMDRERAAARERVMANPRLTSLN